MNDRLLLRRIRIALTLFIGGLVLSGLTAFPIRTELEWLLRRIDSSWLGQVQKALEVTDNAYPFLAYGTDWLAFAHLAIATAFIGPWLEPVRNKWVITFGLIACAGVIPLALIAGSIRGIPLSWRLVDCSFGVLGAVPLWMCRRFIAQLERA